MQTLSRRGLFVLGGTGVAGVTLAACGGRTSGREDADDAALLEAALGAEAALGVAYRSPAQGSAPDEAAAIESFRAASDKRGEELRSLLADAGGDGSGAAQSTGSQTEAAEAAIAAYRAAAGPLSTEQLRGTMIAFLAAVAAELAALREFAGEQPVPRAFVTGGEQDPYEQAPDTTTDQGAQTTTTTTQEDGQ